MTPLLFHIAVIASSNYLVQFPFTITLPNGFAVHSTWGALTALVPSLLRPALGETVVLHADPGALYLFDGAGARSAARSTCCTRAPAPSNR